MEAVPILAVLSIAWTVMNTCHATNATIPISSMMEVVLMFVLKAIIVMKSAAMNV